jgi:hypothetical protein
MGVVVGGGSARPLAPPPTPLERADKMSHTLKDAANSTLETVSHLVDDARERIEHLPLPHRKTPSWRSKWAVALAALAVLGALSAGWMLQRRRADHHAADRASKFAHSHDASMRAADAAASRVDLVA